MGLIHNVQRHAFLVLALLVLAGDATAKAFGAEKEAKHVFRWDKGRDK